MMPFQFSQSKSGDILDFTIQGHINDESQFPNVDLSGVTKVNINVENVSFINSGGVRKWMVWGREIGLDKGALDVTYIHLPTVLSKQVVSIDGFIASAAKLKSLVIPFYCEECEHAFKGIFEKGSTLNNKSAAEMIASGKIEMPCPKCAFISEVDGNVKQFIGLLSRF